MVNGTARVLRISMHDRQPPGLVGLKHLPKHDNPAGVAGTVVPTTLEEVWGEVAGERAANVGSGQSGLPQVWDRQAA